MTIEKTLEVERMEQIINAFGNFDENVRIVETHYGVKIAHRGDEIKVIGAPEGAELASQTMQGLLGISMRGESVTEQNVRYVISLVDDGKADKLYGLASDSVCITAKGRQIKPKTLGQKSYIEKIKKNTVTFAIGPAGTGKTYLAVAMAVTAFRNKEINKLIITRPAVEAGEKLGFLPGDLQNKVDPYLRPLHDALHDMLGVETYQKYLERGNIEVAPLAYMRGRTLDDSYIILDEAQNTTSEQMKMFLTRLGFGSKVIVTGDVTQIDLPEGKKSGLKEAAKLLQNIDGIAFSKFTDKDVVRHPLVQKIVLAYDNPRGAKK